jgi:DNA-directed RNA polymerase specialized sigma24 family protein
MTVESFADFYDSHRREAMQLAWLLTHDESLCDDVVHDAFAAVLPRFESLDRPEAYLRVVLVNRIRERARRRDRERRRHDLYTAAVDRFDAGPTGGVIDVVAKLPLRPRTVVVLRYWAGLTDAELGEVVGVRPGSVRSILSRAMAQLREELQ